MSHPVDGADDRASKIPILKMIPGVLKAALFVSVIMAFVLFGVRSALISPQGRHLIELQLNGLKIGRLGRLGLEGFKGDILRRFEVRRLTLADAGGVWLDARNVAVSWRPSRLLMRTAQIDAVTATQVSILRRPHLGPAEPASASPLALRVAQFATRLAVAPEVVGQRGLYDVTARLHVPRSGGPAGALEATSLRHAGDHLVLKFDLTKSRARSAHADGLEAEGGAIAGFLGLASNQAFELKADAEDKGDEGHFSIVTLSGTNRPVEASGAWSKRGGVARGRLSLAASAWTADLARRIGPEVAINANLAPATKGVSALSLVANSKYLTLALRGPVDLGHDRLGRDGVIVALNTAEVSQVVGPWGAGPGAVRGRLSGDFTTWKFAGDAAFARIGSADYAVASLKGPLGLVRRRDSLELNLTLVGSGGAGRGLAAAMLGARPVAKISFSRLDNGRIFIRDLGVTGPGLKLSGSGGRTLLGGSSFGGNAQITNLAQVRAASAGSLQAKWRASQGGGDRPWNVGLDITGAKLATGYPELDRLLGSSPQAKASGFIGRDRVMVSGFTVVGTALKAAGDGQWSVKEGLKGKFEWSAQGPFAAGPVQVSGRAKGTGAVAGALAQPRLDLAADFQAIDIPGLPLTEAHMAASLESKSGGIAGEAAISASSGYGPATAKSGFAFPAHGVDLTDLTINAGGVSAGGYAKLRDGGASTADLHLVITRGALLQGGRLTGDVRLAEGVNSPTVHLNLIAEGAAPRGAALIVRAGRLQADGRADRLPYVVNATGVGSDGIWTLAGHGLLTQNDTQRQLNFDGAGRYGRRDLKTSETAQWIFGGASDSIRLRLRAGDGGQIDVDARTSRDKMTAQVQVRKLGLGLINEDLDGKIEGSLDLNGQSGRLMGDLNARLDAARGRGTATTTGLSGALRGQLRDTSLRLEALVQNAQGLNASADLTLPTETSVRPLRIAINRKSAIAGKFAAEGEVKPLWDLLVGGDRDLSGGVKLNGVIGGTLADPRAVGRAELAGGRFIDGATGLTLRDLGLTATMADNLVELSAAQAGDGHGGTATGSGRISLVRGGASSLKLNLKGFRLIDNQLGVAQASGEAHLDRNAEGKVRLSGDLTVDRADLTSRTPNPSGVVEMAVVEVNRPVDVMAIAVDKPQRASGMALDVKLTAPRRVFVRGRGLDVELSLDARVRGSTDQPVLTGAARVVRGDYDFAGKRFQFDERGVVYLAISPSDIRLDLSATRQDPAFTAVVKIQGFADRPKIILSSTPVLPDDEVLSQVLFARSASQLSPLEAAQLASALSALAGGGGFDVIGNLRGLARLDRLSLTGGGATGISVSGGKYLTDDVYLELTGGGREGPSAQVEWRIGKALSIISKLATQGDNRLSVRWRKDGR